MNEANMESLRGFPRFALFLLPLRLLPVGLHLQNPNFLSALSPHSIWSEDTPVADGRMRATEMKLFPIESSDSTTQGQTFKICTLTHFHAEA